MAIFVDFRCETNRNVVELNLKIIGDTGVPTCEFCKKTFKWRSALLQHRRVHTKEKPHVCETCGAAFGSYAGLWKHRAVHNEDRPFVCGTCNKVFKRAVQLKYHSELHTGTELLPCPQCSYTTVSQRCLQLHSDTHRAKLKHVCKVCGKGFNAKSLLLEHLNRHSGERPFRCGDCGKCYHARSSLTAHEQSKHLVSTHDICGICGRLVKGGKRGMQRHVRTHAVDSFVEGITCVDCGLVVSSEPELVVHQRLHSGESPFLCNSCPEAFISDSLLRAHKRAARHEPLKCNHCSRSFKKPSRLAVHLETCFKEPSLTETAIFLKEGSIVRAPDV